MIVTACKHEKSLFIAVLIVSMLGWGATAFYFKWSALFAAALVMLAYLSVLLFFICRMRGMGVRVSAAQFPDIYERARNCAEKMNLQVMPQVFIMNGNGVFNAFTIRFARQHYVVLHSEIVNAAEKRPAVLDFYIGHEMGRIQRGYLLYLPLLAPGLSMPLLGSAYLRAQEYTCDQYGAVCSGPEAAMEGIALLVAGAQRFDTLNKQEYIEQAAMVSGFSMSFCELLFARPWLVKRFQVVSGQQPSRHHALAFLPAIVIPRLDWTIAAVLYVVLIADLSEGASKAMKNAFTQDYNQRKLSTAEMLAADVETINEKAARKALSNAIKFREAVAESGDTLVYYYDVALPRKKIDIPAFVKKETKNDIKYFCSNDSMDEYRARNMKIVSRHYDVAGVLLAEIVSDNSQCGRISDRE